MGRTIPDEPQVQPLPLRTLLIAASVVAMLSIAIPRVAGASAGVHFTWEQIATHPANVLCVPAAGLIALVVSVLRIDTRVRGLIAVLVGGLAPAVLGALDRRLGPPEALALAGALALATCVLVAQARWVPLALKLSPLAGSAALVAAYVIPAAGRMPIRGVIDLLQGRATAIAGHGKLAGALLLLPLVAIVLCCAYVAVAALRRVSVSMWPAHVVLAAVPLTMAGLGMIELLDQRPEWVAWLHSAAQVAGALYLTSAGLASAIVAPAE